MAYPKIPDLKPRPKRPEAAERIEWLASECLSLDADTREVHRRLLKIGGDAVTPIYEEDAALIIAKAVLFDGRVMVQRGARNQCHANSAGLWHANRDVLSLCTGYGLSWDEDGVGCWRQHSWCWADEDGFVVETTSRRHAYYGVILSQQQALDFYAGN